MADKHLPRILCLHGSGSSAAIFSVQSRRIRRALRYHFRFVFVNGPFETTAGPGVLRGTGPYYRWMPGRRAWGGLEATEEQDAEMRVVRKLLSEELAREDGEPFVGIMGFSQGALLTTAVLLQHQLKERTKIPQLKFAILLCGTYHPRIWSCFPEDRWSDLSSRLGSLRITQSEVYSDSDSGFSSDAGSDSDSPQSSTSSTSTGSLGDYRRRVLIPSIHAQGLGDPWLPESRMLVGQCYDPRTSKVVEFEGGHHIMSSQTDIDKLANAILCAYDESV
ncbi:hypothetical protein FGG08_006531 [Glutinoglossum americanum]|uniref:Serine hydrolase domain-containing protein n=1 Tax=Glutinoglossum americanum TaxID=1670608 RepID=A0A9P8HVU1_9PEZI|nr:hypothetical protein FGG08_006531 [Glutinoglossum americanum]